MFHLSDPRIFCLEAFFHIWKIDYTHIMGRIIPFLIILFATANTIAQSPYRLSWKTDGIVSGSILFLAGSDIALNANLESLTEEQILKLDASDINGFDRWATLQNSSAAGIRSDIGQDVPVIAGLGALILYPSITDNNESWLTEFATLTTLFLETNLVNSGITEVVKTAVKRPRPYAYDPERSLESKQSKNIRKSFFSGHTSASAANSWFLAKVFSDYYPENKWKPVVWGVATAIPAWTGLERVLAGKHYPTDVIAGYIAGAACGFFIPHFHKRDKDSLDISFYGNGLAFSHTF